jgi:hypothetical protein
VAEVGLAIAYALALRRSDPDLLRRLGAAPRILAAAGLALAVSLVVGLGDIADVLIATAVYAIALMALRAIPSELREAVLGRVTGPPGV